MIVSISILRWISPRGLDSVALRTCGNPVFRTVCRRLSCSHLLPPVHYKSSTLDAIKRESSHTETQSSGERRDECPAGQFLSLTEI